MTISSDLLDRLATLLGPKGFTADQDVIGPWLTDWRGRFHGAATAMLSPGSIDEVVEIVRLAGSVGVPLVPQGGNTSMVGGATPPADGSALLLSMRRMNRVRSMSAEDGVAIAEAGVILSDFHDAAAAVGRRFPLSLGAKGSATIGGLVSTNAGGTQVLRFGTMRSLVLGIEAVLPDGSRVDGLAPLKKDNRGYDLKHLLIAAEGTLGIVTAASLKLVPAVADRAVAWAGLASPADALALLRRLEEAKGAAIESFELVPDDCLARVLRHIPGTRAPLEGGHRWHALIEATADEGAAAVLERAIGAAIDAGFAADATIAASEAQAEALWRLRDSISEAERASGPGLAHDISVPVASMPAFMVAAAERIEAEFPGVSASGFGHLGDGNVHFHVRAPEAADTGWPANPGEAISRRVHDLVVAAGGSISAEHGIGQMKVDEFERLADPGRISALRAIKRAIDPRGLMNPGKLVPCVAPSAAIDDGADRAGACARP